MSLLAEFDVVDEAATPCPLSEQELADTIAYVLEHEGVQVPCALSLTLVDDERMAELNAEWRGQERPTDVLSLECERPDEAVGLCELGDIILAPAYVREQAPQFGNSAADECRLLTIHATLHLLGYDHIVDEEAQVMERLEDAYLAELSPAARGGRLTRHTAADDGADA